MWPFVPLPAFEPRQLSSPMFLDIPACLRLLITSLLWDNSSAPSSPSSELQFQLRHTHGVSNNSRIIFSDIPQSYYNHIESYTVKTQSTRTHRPPSFSTFSNARERSIRHGQSTSIAWDEVEIQGPNATNRQTLLTLAKMTSNAYFNPSHKDWYDLGPDWNSTFSYGWEPDSDGFRGHIFVSTDASTVVVSIKGTSVPILGGGPTTRKDKLNDNLLFSCCCARVGPTWHTACGCYEGGNKCDSTCVQNALVEESLFYPVGTVRYRFFVLLTNS